MLSPRGTYYSMEGPHKTHHRICGTSMEFRSEYNQHQEVVITSKNLFWLAYGIVYEDNRLLHNKNSTAMSYDDAVVELGLPRLNEQREILTIQFGIDTFNFEWHNCFFEERNTCYNNHQIQPQNPRT